MKLYLEVVQLLFKKYILRKNSGIAIKDFSENMGIVYIKLAQILATQNYGNLFTEEDRKQLSSICDNCRPISYKRVEKILKKEYGKNFHKIFQSIEKEPVGSASVSQVHKAILKSGEEVAIKIKRTDITSTMEKDIKKIKKLIHKYGKLFHFGNFKGADLTLNLYLDWLKQEIDFKREKENIKIYSEYTKRVNKKIRNTKELRVPKLYEEYCTDNVIVMEFIKYKTINQMELTKENKEKIVEAINSYIQLNFFAMYHEESIAFHGDPHSGNLCIDEEGNLYFLDMGLLFVLNQSESNLCRDFFLAAYTGNYEKIYQMLVVYGDMNEKRKKKFKENCKKYVEKVSDKNVTHYFIDMIEVCLSFEFVPPSFLINMAKAFICIYGISNFSDNRVSARELLSEQTIEFIMKRSISDCKKIIIDDFPLALKSIDDIQQGLVRMIMKIIKNKKLKEEIETTLENGKEALYLAKSFYNEMITPLESTNLNKK